MGTMMSQQSLLRNILSEYAAFIARMLFLTGTNTLVSMCGTTMNIITPGSGGVVTTIVIEAVLVNIVASTEFGVYMSCPAHIKWTNTMTTLPENATLITSILTAENLEFANRSFSVTARRQF